jgi:hypothetical protein
MAASGVEKHEFESFHAPRRVTAERAAPLYSNVNCGKLVTKKVSICIF